MVRSTTGKAGGFVKFAHTAVWPGNVATPSQLHDLVSLDLAGKRI